MEGEKKVNSSIISVILSYLFLAFLFCLLVGIAAGWYFLLALFLPTFLAWIAMLVSIVWLLQFIISSMVFPGAVTLMRRSQELQLMQHRASYLKTKLESILELIDLIVEQNTTAMSDFEPARVMFIVDRMSNMLLTFERIATETPLNEFQKYSQSKFKAVMSALDATYVSLGVDPTIPLSQLLRSNSYLYDLKLNCALSRFLGETSVEDCKTAIIELLGHLQEIQAISDLPIRKRWKQWRHNNSFCCLKFYKAELLQTYKTKLIPIKISKSVNLDCLLVYAGSGPSSLSTLDEEQSSQHSRDPIQKEQNPTIILCNPNAGFYELAIYSNQWLDFYHQKGVNVCLWNYRGYGESTGCPSPLRLFKDAEVIVDYLREKEQMTRIGVHGQSLGGMVACHVASAKKLDFLFADRTFSCISDIAQYSMAKIFRPIIRIVSSFDVWSASNFSSARCYKVLAFDPKDEVITYLASLKVGVTITIAEQHLRRLDSSYVIHNQDRSESVLSNYKGFVKRTFCADLVVDTANRMWMKDSDIRELYSACKRITDIVKFVLAPQQEQPGASATAAAGASAYIDASGNLSVGSPTGASSQSDSQEMQSLQDKKKKPIQQRSAPTGPIMKKQSVCDLNITLDYSNILNGSTLLESMKDDEERDGSLLQINLAENSQNHVDSSDLPPNFQFGAESDSSASTNLALEKIKNSNSKLVDPKDENSAYLSLLENSHRSNEDLRKVVKVIFTLFDSYDAGGLTLIDVFCLFQKKRSFDIFKLFVLNLNIWGSKLPLNQVIRKNLVGDMPNKYAEAKTKEIIKKLLSLSKPKQHLNGLPQTFSIKLFEDIAIVAKKLKLLKEKLSGSKDITNSNDQLLPVGGRRIEQKQDQFNEDQNPLAAAVSPVEKQSLKYANLKDEVIGSTIPIDDVNKVRGNLIPVSCGHNGNFSELEISVLDHHLKNSGFLNKNNNS